jgi:hypothetical protein
MNKQIRDQLAHAGAAFLCLLPLAIAPNIIGGILSGFLVGLVREVTEEGDPVSIDKLRAALGSWKDLLGWTLGGLVLGIIA